MNILNRLGLNVGNKDETNKHDRLYYAVAENYKISSIELENIQLKDAINETMKASSEDFKGVVDKVKSGLSNIWEKILSIFEAIRKFIKSIIDKVFKRKIKKDLETTKTTLEKAAKSTPQGTTKRASTSTVNIPKSSIDKAKTVVDSAKETTNIQNKDFTYVRICGYYYDNVYKIDDILSRFSNNIDFYSEVLLEKDPNRYGIIPALVDYLDNGEYDTTLSLFKDGKKKLFTVKFENDIKDLNDILSKSIESGYVVKELNKISTSVLIHNIKRIEKLYSYVSKDLNTIDRSIGDVIYRIRKLIKYRSKKNRSDEKRLQGAEQVLESVKNLQNLVTKHSKGIITTFGKLVKYVSVTSVIVEKEKK